MKYWGYFAAKLLGLVGVMKLLWVGLLSVVPQPETFMYVRVSRFAQDLPWTLVFLFYTLFGAGLLHLIILDQRYRCRTCLRRLRMPVETGSWTHMLLFGRPRIEYICPYGHGTLKVPEVKISGLEYPDWQPHEDMWTELTAREETKK